MSFFQRLAALFSGRPSSGQRYLTIYVLSNRCREPIVAQIDTLNELSLTDEGEHPYFVRKLLHSSGRNRCFDQVEVQVWFDKNKQIAAKQVSGGRWLEQDEYEAVVEAEAKAQAEAEAEKEEHENGEESGR